MPSRISAQDDRTKLILDLDDASTALHDLEVDPDEMRDISEERPDLLREARARIDAHLSELRRYPSYRPIRATLDEEDVERLRSLGYVD